MHEKAAISQGGKTPLIWRCLPIVILVATGIVIWLAGGMDYLSLEELIKHRGVLTAWVSAHHLTALLAFMAVYVVVVALSLPAGAVLTVAGGFLFGCVVGCAATVIAATIGAVIVFLLARTAFAEPLAHRAGPWLDKLRHGFQDDAISYLLFLRLVPAFPFWLVNLAPALFGVRLCDYTVATVFGIVPGTFAFSLAGSGLDSVLAAQKTAFDQCVAQNPAPGACTFELDPACWLTPELLAAFVALGVIALVPAIAKRVWHRTAAT